MGIKTIETSYADAYLRHFTRFQRIKRVWRVVTYNKLDSRFFGPFF